MSTSYAPRAVNPGNPDEMALLMSTVLPLIRGFLTEVLQLPAPECARRIARVLEAMLDEGKDH